MAHTLDELRKYRNGRGTSSASSSDSQGRHTLEELRSLDTRRRPQTTQSIQMATTPSEPIRSDRSEGVSSSWMSRTGNATLDSINNMLSMRKVMQTANATPKNMPTLQTNEEVKDYYESLGNHNAIERLFNKEKAEEYNQKQALYPQYHEIKKEEDMKKLAEYGITDDDMRKYASYLDESSRNNFFRGDTRRQVETRRTDQEIQNIKKATGVDLYDYLDEYKGELAKEDANAHPVLSTLNTYAQNPGESLTNVATDVGAYATGKPIKDNYSYTDTVRNEITENIDSGVGRFAYGTVNSIADMGVAMALGTVTGGGTFVSAGTMGLEKASNVMNGAVDRGLTPNQIMLEGIASGVTTAATEAIPMGKWEEVAKKGFVGLHGKALAKEITKKFLANALPEGLQEMEEDIADAIMDELIAGDKSEINVTISKLMENGYSREQAEAMAWRDWTKQMVLDGLGGFISGGVMSSGSIAVGLANPYARGEVNREALSEQIKGMDTEGETYKAYRELSEKRGENLENATENEVSDLFLKAYEEASTFDRTEVNEIFKEELKKHDYSEEQANETLEAVLAENKTNYQKSLINNSLVKDALKTAYESDEGLNMRLKTRMNQTALEDTIKTSDQVKTEKKIAKAESKINTAEESSVNGEKVEILGMDIKGGVYVINTDKGTFNADDVNVASSIKDAVAYSVNIKDPAFKEAFVTNYRGQDIDTYEAYAYEAFTAGKNFNASILEQGNYIDFLGANALEDFLDAGRMSVSRSTKESEERSIKAAAEAEGKFQKGTFTSEVDYNSLKSTQKKVYNFLKGMSNIGGLNINVIYNTETVENGFFQYDSESGGTITVNLAAKARVDEKGIGSTYVIPVLSHELTHYLEKNAESSYMILQKAVFKVLRADGMNIDDEVRSKIEKYKAHNVELTPAEAVHEIVAQACEGMMSNENTMKKTLSYMNERDMKTFKKALDKFFNAVKQFVKSLAGGDEIQNKYADAISRNIDEVQDAWAKAFADALKRQQTLNKEVGLNEEMTADNGTTVVGEDYAQFNIQTYDKSLPFLKDWLKKSGLSTKEQSNILSELESKRDMLEAIRKEYPHFDEWSMHDSQEEAIASMGDMDEETEKAMRKAVAKYLTAIVNNSEYPYNFDLTTVCKKRQTLNKVLNMLVTDGMFDDFIPDEKTITDLVDTIKANGFEVACALCFVDSKRYRIGSWADSIINGVDAYNQKKKVWVHSYGWNEIVKSMEVKGKVSVNDFNFLNRDIDNEKPNRLASNMTVDELREAGALKLIDKILETESGNTRNKKFANAILRNPSIAHTANVAELLSSEGLDIARIKAPDFHQVVNGASGQATPKLSHDAITYQNDILRKLVEKNVTPEDLYKVGGFRVQSFSDYVANEIFDYIQMVSELAANKFPSHAYTKEYFFVKLFGMTGMKINMSIVPKAFSDNIREEFKKKYKGWTKEKREADPEYQYYKKHCGLEKGTNEDGSYDWEDPDGTKWHYIIEDESFGAIRNREKNTYDPYAGFKKALEIQSDPRYNKNCGIIWVGVSDAHIRAMMRDKRIPMVIPYHRSSINHLVAEMRAIDSYNDYTPYQVEKRLNGKSFKKETLAKRMADWDFYADLRNSKNPDPVQTSKNYVKYCLEHKVRPVFYQFAFEEGFEGDFDHFEEGYYKLLTDFRLYGGNTDGTMDTTFAEQGAVTMTFPEEFESLAKESLAEYEDDTTYLDENQEKLYEEAKKIIEKNKKENKQMSLQEDSEGNKLTEGQQNYFKNSKVVDENGNLIVLYHGTISPGFTKFNTENLIYLTSDRFVAKSFSNASVSTDYFNPNTGEGSIYKLYANIENPLIVDATKTVLSGKYDAKISYDRDTGRYTVELTNKDRKHDYTTYNIGEIFDEKTVSQINDHFDKNVKSPYSIKNKNVLIQSPSYYYDVEFNGEKVGTDDIADYAKKNGYDGVIVNNVIEGGEYSGAATDVIVFDANQIKSVNNENPTKKKDILYSLQEESEIPDDEKATYQTLEDDVKLLRDFTKLAKEDMKWQAKDMNAFSEYLIMKYDSTISEKDLKEELANLFNAIPEQTDNWLNVMDACFGLASEIYEVSNKKVSVDKNVDADARQAVQAAKRRNAIQQIAIDIYNKYWTMTSYYTDNERAKGLKAQHRQNIKNAVEKQKIADTIYYKNLIEKTKRRAEEDRARIKTKTENRIKAMRESNERKAEIQKIEDQAAMFDKWIKQNSKNHPVPDILREPLEMLLTTIDPVTREKGKANKKQESLSLSIQKVASALSNINNEMAKTDKPNGENTESGLEMLDIPPYMVAELNEIATKMHELEVNYEVPGSKPLQLMELADLKKLKQDMNAIQKAISTANNLITRANKERVNYVGQKIISYLSKLPQAKRDALNETLTKGVDFLTLDNTTPFYFFKHLGECGSILFDILADGMDDMTNKVEEISDFTEAIYTEEDQKKWRNNIREFELLQKLTDTERASGKENKVKVKLTDAQIMSLYCLSKRVIDERHQALEHILRDGIAIGKIDAKKKIARQDTVTITESQLNDIISIVENDKKMKAVADALQHFMSSVCSDWGNKVTMSRWGIKQFTEKFYFPIAVNAELKKSDAADSVGSLFALLNQDFTKPPQDKVRNEIMVYDIFDVFTKHTSDMARYSALGLPILDLIKVWNYSEAEEKTSGNKDEDEEYQQRKVSSVKKSIAKAFGERGGNKYISTLIKNLNGKADKGVYDNIGMGMMKRYKASKVAASTMTALVQPLSIFRAAYVMDNKYLLRGLAHRPQIDKCFKNVGVAKWKRMSIGVDTNIGRGVDRIINHQTTFGDKVMDKSLWLAEKMDELTWGYIYNAVEEEVKDTRKNLKPDTEEFDEAVSKRAREVFYATQIFDSTLTRSAFMRDKGYHAVILSAFMSEPTLSYNMLLDSVTEYYQDAKINGSSHAFNTKGKVVASAISIYVLSAAVESVIREAFTRIRDYDEDDEEFFDGFVMAVVDRLLDELNILNKLPYTKQLMDGLSAFKSGYRNNNKMDEAFISDIANSYKAIKKAVEREEVTYKTVYTTLNALSDVTGLPFANALREVKAVWNNTIGRITGNYFK